MSHVLQRTIVVTGLMVGLGLSSGLAQAPDNTKVNERDRSSLSRRRIRPRTTCRIAKLCRRIRKVGGRG